MKKTIEQIACSLPAAIFDKADCAGCQHNSANQGEMFGEFIGTGNCTNRTCYNEKTEKALETVATGLRDEYPVVRIVRAGDNHTRIQLAVGGPKGVGEEQAKACHACQNYGAAVSGPFFLSALVTAVRRSFQGSGPPSAGFGKRY